MPCSRTQHSLTRVGLEPPTSGSGVRGINHQATALPNGLIILSQSLSFLLTVNHSFSSDRRFILLQWGFQLECGCIHKVCKKEMKSTQMVELTNTCIHENKVHAKSTSS